MSYEINLTWKYFAKVRVDKPQKSVLDSHSWINSSLFNIRTGKALLRDIGGNVTNTLYPLVLEPKSDFYNKLITQSERQNLHWKKFPFSMQVKTAENEYKRISTNFTIHQYENWLCLTISLSSFELSSVENLFEIQNINYQNELDTFSGRIFDITLATSCGYHKSTRLPCLQIVCLPKAAPLNDNLLASIITRHHNVRPEIAKDVLARNKDHQIDGTLLLCDKQGVLLYAPPQTSKNELKSSRRRFKSAMAMSEVCLAISKLLDGNTVISSVSFTAIDKLINNSTLLFASSVSGGILWQVFCRAFLLQTLFDNYQLTMKTIQSKYHTKILCVAAADTELKAIHQALSVELNKPELKTFIKTPVLEFTDKKSNSIWYLGSQDGQGIGFAIQDTIRLIGAVQPDLIIMIGMCMGMPKKGLIPGTVIVPNSIFSLDHQRITTNQTEYRPRGESVGQELHRYARLIAADTLPYQVIVDKKIATANAKIESQEADLVKYIESALNDVIAYDMEGWGFFRGADDTPALWIKAVADSGEEQSSTYAGQSEKHVVQKTVTNNAIDFALRLVRAVVSVR